VSNQAGSRAYAVLTRHRAFRRFGRGEPHSSTDGSYTRITWCTHVQRTVSRRKEVAMGQYFARHRALIALITVGVVVLGILAGEAWMIAAQRGEHEGGLSDFLDFSAPAGNRPATTSTTIDGVRAAVLPNGRLVTPAGTEGSVQAPKPFGMALSPDGRTNATLNSGGGPFSLTLITQLASPIPVVKRVDVNASFMGVTFSADSKRVYLSGGENGNIWIADPALGKIVGSINLNGPAHPLDRPLDVVATPAQRIKGAYPGNMVLTSNGRFL